MSVVSKEAQVHILEMVTLFWLFFMTATFILTLRVPDPVSPASDAGLHLAAEDAFDALASEGAEDSANHTSLLAEMLNSGQENQACDVMLNELRTSVRGNCWLAENAGPLENFGVGSAPEGRTLSVHHLVYDSGTVWTVSLQVWHTGGGA
jgi:hypothetical protein